jgi:hypothetical protein
VSKQPLSARLAEIDRAAAYHAAGGTYAPRVENHYQREIARFERQRAETLSKLDHEMQLAKALLDLSAVARRSGG